ncbi:MAG: hypothetical protein LBU26_05625 [Synergistaceae bacterium]|jgi:hypothetical protein|nr:hypothetical protein [Synergistaceae bacterium]
MPNGKGLLPRDKAEEQGRLSRLNNLAPLLTVILRLLELILKIFGVIR